MKEEKSLLYNPQKELPLNLELAPNSWVISVLFQSNFMLYFQQADYITFFEWNNKTKIL
jgi:hypothetical protein